MKIQVLGSGCPTCKALYELTQKAVLEMGIKDEVEYITDITKIIELGVMSSPVLAINGKVVMTGSTNDIEKIKDLIRKCSESNSDYKCCDNSNCDCNKPDCNCGTGCC